MKDHQIGGHLRRDLDLLGLQLRVHAEQHVMGVTVVPCTSNTHTQSTVVSRVLCCSSCLVRVCVNKLVPAHCSSLAMMMAVRAASLYCCSAM